MLNYYYKKILINFLTCFNPIPCLGSCDIPLKTLMDSKGISTDFEAPIHLYGKFFGKLKGNKLF